MTDMQRREALKTGGKWLAALSVLAMVPASVLAAPDRAPFAAKKVEDALNALGVKGVVDDPNAIKLTAPEIAENGAVVPIGVVSSLPDTQQIIILVDKNPFVLAADFSLQPGTEGMVTTRVKMGQTGNVVALVKADGKFYRASREVKVTAGGCGG